MKQLFAPGEINAMTVKNRFVRSATWEGMATADGAVTDKLVDVMAALARGEVGLIISGHAYIARAGQAGPFQLGIYSDELLPGLEKMVSAVHAEGGKIVAQLAHAGYFAADKLTGTAPLAVSADVDLDGGERQEITAGDIDEIIGAFADAARRAQAAGFDGVQIHAGHGYLLSQFLSPLFNRRLDGYGGSIHNRLKIPVAVIQSMRDVLGPDYPILIKMNGRDFADGGLELTEAVVAAQAFEKAGIDAIELSGGLQRISNLGPGPSRVGINSPAEEAYHREEAKAFKTKIKVPLILVGGLRSLEVARQLMAEGVADYFSMSRPLIREPDLVKRWQAGDLRPSECKSDNLCFRPGMRGDGVYCVTAARKKPPQA